MPHVNQLESAEGGGSWNAVPTGSVYMHGDDVEQEARTLVYKVISPASEALLLHPRDADRLTRGITEPVVSLRWWCRTVSSNRFSEAATAPLTSSRPHLLSAFSLPVFVCADPYKPYRCPKCLNPPPHSRRQCLRRL
jgi:hypothetical protein